MRELGGNEVEQQAAGEPTAGDAGKRALVARRYPVLSKALGERAGSASVHDAATAAIEGKGGGSGLDGEIAGRVGAHLGADFSSVRVHRDELAQESTAAMGARAFAYGNDIFLGPGESGGDVGLMAHELTHVVQQGAAGQRQPQRQVQVGEADSPAEHEADRVAADVTGGQGRPAQLIVDDGPVQPGQMLKSQFIEQLRALVTAAADEELGPMYSAIGCPYIDRYFSRYTSEPASAGESLLHRFAPATRNARTAADMIGPVVARVRDGVRLWRETGQPPAEIAAAEPAAAAMAGPPQAQALRSADGRETLESLEAELGPGAPLDASTASRMSGALGIDVSSARIHTGPVAARKAADAAATAFTVGPNIVLGSDSPASGTLESDALLAHELAHTVQQAAAARDPVARMQPIGAESVSAEANADDMVAEAASLGERERPGVAARLARRASESLAMLTTGLQLQRCSRSSSSSSSAGSATAMGSLTPTGSVAHTTGAQLDTYVSGTAAISAYVSPLIAAGRVATGNVHILNDADFRARFMAYATAGGMSATDATSLYPSVNAFQDPSINAVFLHENRGTPSTAIHEGMHLYQNTAFDTLGFNVSEGTTEWLCRMVIADRSLGYVRTNYQPQYESVRKMAAKAGNAAVMDAYFNGNTAGLRTAVDAATAAGTFDRWRAFVNAGNHASADALM